VPAAAASTVLDRFTELGLVDDEAFASAWVESRHQGRGLAPRALRRELRQRGIDDETAEAALASIDDESQSRAAQALVQARLPSLARYDRPTQLRRLQGLLVRRGYAPGLAWTVVRSALADADAGGGAWTDDAEEPV
jgi:regulatory protein